MKLTCEVLEDDAVSGAEDKGAIRRPQGLYKTLYAADFIDADSISAHTPRPISASKLPTQTASDRS